MVPNRNVLFQTHLLFVTIYGLMWSFLNIRWCWHFWKSPITTHVTLSSNANKFLFLSWIYIYIIWILIWLVENIGLFLVNPINYFSSQILKQGRQWVNCIKFSIVEQSLLCSWLIDKIMDGNFLTNLAHHFGRYNFNRTEEKRKSWTKSLEICSGFKWFTKDEIVAWHNYDKLFKYLVEMDKCFIMQWSIIYWIQSNYLRKMLLMKRAIQADNQICYVYEKFQ